MNQAASFIDNLQIGRQNTAPALPVLTGCTSVEDISKTPTTKRVGHSSDRTAPVATSQPDETAKTSLDNETYEVGLETVYGTPRLHAVETIKDVQVRPIQKWEGVVESIDGEIFHARLRDLTLESIDFRESGDFQFWEVHQDDKALIKEGAVFYWTISFKTDPRTGQPSTENTIYFRRVAPYTSKRISKWKEKAGAFSELLKRPEKGHPTAG